MIGEGNWRYEVNHDWARLPAGKRFGYTHGVVQDHDGRVYIANQGPEAIVVLDANGHYLTGWGAEYSAGAHGLTISDEQGEEFLYLANTDLAEVVKTTLDGRVIWRRGVPPLQDVYGDERVYSPTETAVAPDGRVFVADGYGQSWIHVYDRSGTYQYSFGGRGDGDEHLDGSHGVSIDLRGTRPLVQVADRNRARVVNFDLDGQYVGTVLGPDVLRFPCTTVHAGGYVYVPDLFARVSVIDGSNRKVADLGDYLTQVCLEGFELSERLPTRIHLDVEALGRSHVVDREQLEPHGRLGIVR